ncbi:sigma-70 family RNA polymerase sigma factor [Blautia producta]|uniref:sigma-70 family RNA polymerase sigma factor n=1 Tax=Blautia producta TaxID=33035 RepID=UPI0036F1F70A
MKNEDLVLNHIKLAYSVAWSMKSTGIEIEDLQSLALLGLVKAARNYDKDRGYKFSSLATTIMRNEILQEVRRQKKQRNQVSLNSPIAEGLFTLADVLEDKKNGFVEAEMHALIEGLEENEKKAVRLIIFQGMKQTEAAGIIGVSQSMTSHYYRSGLQKLRQCI